MTEEITNSTTPAENPANNQLETPSAPETPPTPPTESTTSTAETTTQAPENNGAFAFPKADDTDGILNFRKQCGYPDDVAGYGLPLETEEQKNVLNFIHKCQLDPVAAKMIVDNLAVEITEQEKQSKAQYDSEYAKISAAWGENKKGNESLVSKGCEAVNMTNDQLRGISEIIGVEAALGLMMTVGKLKSDYSGVGGSAGAGDDESIESFISSKRLK